MKMMVRMMMMMMMNDVDGDGHDSIIVILMTLGCQGICVAIKVRQSGAGKAVLESAL